MKILIDALIDTGKLIPLLLFIYFIVGFLEYRYGSRMRSAVIRFGTVGPVFGALFGCIPQCGFSVMASALYIERLISPGTLIAVFLSTSDEAIPVLLSMPEKAGIIWPLMLTKVFIAITAGLFIDFCMRQFYRVKQKNTAQSGSDIHAHSGCCSHELSDNRSKIKSLLFHPLRHTVHIAAFLFVLTLGLNFILDKIGEDKIGALLLNGTLLQPILASFIGFIPNCFASVLLAELFSKNVISFGSLIAGLCAGSGLGPLVLIKENKNVKDTLFVIGLLLSISILAGVIIQFAGGL